MKFNKCNCVCCNSTFSENDDVVVCPVCGSPHHRECWTEKGECSNASLHADGFSWVFPEELKPKEEKKTPVAETVNTNYRFKNGENAVVCPHCHSLNYGNDAFCMKCRKPFVDMGKISDELQENSQGAENQPEATNEHLFNHFQQFGGVRPDVLLDGIPVIEYADYIGEKKSGKYIRRFLGMERFGRTISASLAALFLGPIWFFYRKMYKTGLAFILAILVLSGAMTFCSITEASKQLYSEMGVLYEEFFAGNMTIEEMQQIAIEKEQEYFSIQPEGTDRIKGIAYSVFEFMQLTLRLAMAFVANAIYKKKIKADILKIREECTDMITYRRTLRERGGVSTGGAVIGVIASVVITIIQFIPGYYYMFSSVL